MRQIRQIVSLYEHTHTHITEIIELQPSCLSCSITFCLHTLPRSKHRSPITASIARGNRASPAGRAEAGAAPAEELAGRPVVEVDQPAGSRLGRGLGPLAWRQGGLGWLWIGLFCCGGVWLGGKLGNAWVTS